MTEIMKIPVERLKELIGEGGRTKKMVEEKCHVELLIDSDGEVQIAGEASDIFFAKDVVKAIGRGFSPHHALKLLDSDYGLYLIPLKDIAKSDKTLIRLKGRVIGEKGKIKSRIEEATGSYMSIYGSTIGIISAADTMEYAKEAVVMILEGARHATVLGYLAKAKREIMENRLRS